MPSPETSRSRPQKMPDSIGCFGINEFHELYSLLMEFPGSLQVTAHDRFMDGGRWRIFTILSVKIHDAAMKMLSPQERKSLVEEHVGREISIRLPQNANSIVDEVRMDLSILDLLCLPDAVGKVYPELIRRTTGIEVFLRDEDGELQRDSAGELVESEEGMHQVIKLFEDAKTILTVNKVIKLCEDSSKILASNLGFFEPKYGKKGISEALKITDGKSLRRIFEMAYVHSRDRKRGPVVCAILKLAMVLHILRNKPEYQNLDKKLDALQVQLFEFFERNGGDIEMETTEEIYEQRGTQMRTATTRKSAKLQNGEYEESSEKQVGKPWISATTVKTDTRRGWVPYHRIITRQGKGGMRCPYFDLGDIEVNFSLSARSKMEVEMTKKLFGEINIDLSTIEEVIADALGFRFEVDTNEDAKKMFYLICKFFTEKGMEIREVESHQLWSLQDIRNEREGPDEEDGRILVKVADIIDAFLGSIPMKLPETVTPENKDAYRAINIRFYAKGKPVEVQIRLRGDIEKNETGLRHHAPYKLPRQFSAGSKLIPLIPEMCLDEQCKQASSESGVPPELIKGMLMSNGLTEFVDAGGRKYYGHRDVIRQLRNLGMMADEEARRCGGSAPIRITGISETSRPAPPIPGSQDQGNREREDGKTPLRILFDEGKVTSEIPPEEN